MAKSASTQPCGSPAKAIGYSAGHYSTREVVKLGWPMTLAAVCVLLVVISVWWDLVLDLNNW
jgi:di/tricarboxylate transporter